MNPLDTYIAVQTDLLQVFIQKLEIFPLTIRKTTYEKFSGIFPHIVLVEM